MMYKRLSVQRRSVAALAVVGLISGCGQGDQQGGWDAGPPAVEVVTVQPQALSITSDLPGRIEPVRMAEVRARVAGIVLSRKFEEGADVKAGQVLFQIDPAPFEAALSRAQGELARAEAAVFDAQAVVRRYEPLVQVEAVSKQDFDTAQTTLKSAQAAQISAQADVRTARLNLDFATVKAPITGRIGRALVTEGALVGQGEATPMATIQQLNPVYADFKQPVAEALRLRGQTGAKGAPISITVEGTDQKREGHLVFSDITVDRTTGQVLLRGQFANPDGLLLPGMYVRVNTSQGSDVQAILVPQRAVQRSPDGKPLVIVVGKDDVAEARPVTTGAMYASKWHIADGLKAGERVVVDGAGKAQPGRKVTVATPKGASPAPSAPGSTDAPVSHDSGSGSNTAEAPSNARN